MYYSRMGAGAPGNFEGMQRATTGADMVGLNFNTGGQYKGSNPQLAFDQFGSIEDVLQGQTNYGVLFENPYPRPQPQRNTMVPGLNVAQGLPYENGIPMQGPTFPATPVRNYPGMGYGPVGPARGGLPPDPYPARASGFNNKFVS